MNETEKLIIELKENKFLYELVEKIFEIADTYYNPYADKEIRELLADSLDKGLVEELKSLPKPLWLL